MVTVKVLDDQSTGSAVQYNQQRWERVVKIQYLVTESLSHTFCSMRNNCWVSLDDATFGNVSETQIIKKSQKLEMPRQV